MYKTCKKCGVRRNLKIAKECPVCLNDSSILKKKLKIKKRFDYKGYSKDFKLFNRPEEYLMQFSKIQLQGRKLAVTKLKKSVVRVLRNHYKLSFPKIAKLMGYKDHTTALHHYYNDNMFLK